MKDIDSILLANYYFIKCKIEDPLCDKTALARKYLSFKIKEVLSDRSASNDSIKLMDLLSEVNPD